MRVFRDQERQVDPRCELARLRAAVSPCAAADRDKALKFLIEFGEFESAVEDAILPDEDAPHPLADVLRAIAIGAARAWLAPGTVARREWLARELERLDPAVLPPSISLRVSERYAGDASYPDTFVLGARRFHDTTRPQSVRVIGIRSAGTSLSAVVAATLADGGCEIRSCTVRPRGQSSDRRVHLDERLFRALQQDAAAGSTFAIVDEGQDTEPSFAPVVAALRHAGVPPERIVSFPSADADPSSR